MQNSWAQFQISLMDSCIWRIISYIFYFFIKITTFRVRLSEYNWEVCFLSFPESFVIFYLSQLSLEANIFPTAFRLKTYLWSNEMTQYKQLVLIEAQQKTKCQAKQKRTSSMFSYTTLWQVLAQSLESSWHTFDWGLLLKYFSFFSDFLLDQNQSWHPHQQKTSQSSHSSQTCQ